ncbi:MAG: hypothetical protein JNK87_11540 [Bryobacterales bacterium]|nr:hypothetical protein [Bryobacterales bacterium]
MAVETVEGFLLGEVGEGLGFESSAGVMFELVVEFGAGAGHFGVKGLLFHALEAGEAPGGIGDVLDDVALMDIGGLIEVEVLGRDAEVGAAVLGGEDGVLGGEAVRDGVLGDFGFAVWGFGAARLPAVLGGGAGAAILTGLGGPVGGVVRVAVDGAGVAAHDGFSVAWGEMGRGRKLGYIVEGIEGGWDGNGVGDWTKSDGGRGLPNATAFVYSLSGLR